MPSGSDNTSKITAFMVATKALVEESVPGVGEVIILGMSEVKTIVELFNRRGEGQSLSIMPTGGSNEQDNVAGPKITTNFQITIYDSPNQRRKRARHGYEITEDVMRLMHKQNTQGLKGQCEDCLVSDWFVEPVEDAAADLYTVSLAVKFNYQPIRPTTT